MKCVKEYEEIQYQLGCFARTDCNADHISSKSQENRENEDQTTTIVKYLNEYEEI